MSPKKRQDRFFDSERAPKSGAPDSSATHEEGRESGASSSSDEFSIVDSEGQPPRLSGGDASKSSSGKARSRSGEPSEEVAPYIGPSGPARRSSLGWAWLTIVVTLILAVGSYWFYEGFDGDIEKVHERFTAFTNRFVPADRMPPLQESSPSRESAIASGMDSNAPLPVVNEPETSRESLTRPDSVTGQRLEPSNDFQGPGDSPDVNGQVGISLDGTRTDGEASPGVGAIVPVGPQLPTRRGPVSPTRREPPTAPSESDDGGWYRTDPSLSMENAPPDVVAANSPDVTPRPLFRATPQPQMTPFASGVLDSEDSYVNEAPAIQATGRPTAPSVALPSELSSFQETPTPTPVPTPKPTPARPSDSGMAQMSVGTVTAGVQLVDLGLVYASRALTGIHKNFSAPFRKSGAVARISFLIRKNGEIYGVAVEKSSGSDGLDNAALRAVSRTSPLEALPAEIRDEAVRVEVQFEF